MRETRRSGGLWAALGAWWLLWALSACAEGTLPLEPDGDDLPDQGAVDSDGLFDPDQGGSTPDLTGELDLSGEDEAPPDPAKPCEVDGHCPEGELCVDNRCRAGDCRADEDCASAGDVCQDYRCAPGREAEIVVFALDAPQGVRGAPRLLRWEVRWADRVQIIASPDDQSLGAVEPQGQHSFEATQDVSLTLEATNATGTVRDTISLTVVEPLQVLTPEEDQVFTVRQGESWSQALQAVGGAPPLSWRVDGLPEGVLLDEALSLLQGSPAESGRFEVTLVVLDALPEPQRAQRRFVLEVSPPALAVTTASLPAAVRGEPYAAALEAAGGQAPYTWSVSSGALPDGIALSPEGALSGVPARLGVFDLVVQVRDAAPSPQVATRALSVMVTPPPLAFVTESLPIGRVGEAYEVSFAGAGGLPPYRWILTGLLPPGVILNQGSLRGTPTAAFEGELTVQLRDAQEREVVRVFPIQVLPAPLSITTSSLPNGEEGVAYRAALSGAGGSPPYQWGARGLPEGLTLGADGVIEGAPTAAGAASVELALMDSLGEGASVTLPLRVLAAGPRIVTVALPVGREGEPYSAALEGEGGEPPLRWSALGGLPAGLTLSEEGRLSGAPTAAGAFEVRVELRDALERVAAASLPLEIEARPPAPLSITTATLPAGRVGAPYGATLEAAGGEGARTWSVTAPLPEGLTLSVDGVLAGTPAAAGEFVVQAQVEDAREQGATASLALLIEASPVNTGALTLVAGGFFDVRAVGQRLEISDQDDAASPALALGFPFRFFGQPYSQVFVGSNGIVSFEAPVTTPANVTIPTAGGAGAFVAPFWDDLDPGDAGDVYFYVAGASPHRRAVIQWADVDFFTGNDSSMNFEVILYEGTDQIQLLYGPSWTGTAAAWQSAGGSATIGIEDSAGARGVELAFEQPDAVTPGQVWLLTPAPDGQSYVTEGWHQHDGDFQPLGDDSAVAANINGDDTEQALPIGFTFSFSGADHTMVKATSNGLLIFGTGGGANFSNEAIPSATGPNGFIAACWDDLTASPSSAPGAQVRYQTRGEAPARQFVVEWRDLKRLGLANSRLRFQAVLHERSRAVSLHYEAVDFGASFYAGGASATVGVENLAGDQGVQIAYDEDALRAGATVWIVPARQTDTSAWRAGSFGEGMIDISRGGVRSAVSAADDLTEDVAIGFPWDFYGEPVEVITVSSNGWISPGGGVSPSYLSNQALPAVGGPGAILAPFWDDLDPPLDGERGAVLTQTRGSSPDREFVVQWERVPHNNDQGASLSFQVVLYERGGADFFYGPLFNGTGSFADGREATVGVAADAARGQTHSHNQAGAVRSGGRVLVLPTP